MGRKHLDRVAAHAEIAAHEGDVVAPVVQRHEVGEQLVARQPLALLHRERHRRVGLDRADAVDARHGRDDDHVVALEQRARRGVAHAVDLLVHRAFLLDVGVGARHVGFGLVVVVVGDEILDRVVGEEALELAVQLRRERLVGRQDQRRALRAGDHVRHRVGLARAGDAEQHLAALLLVDAGDELRDRGRLVALGRVLGDELEAVAAFGLLGAGRTVRRERSLLARDERVLGEHRLGQEHFTRLGGPLGRLGEQRIEVAGNLLAAGGSRRQWPLLAQGGQGLALTGVARETWRRSGRSVAGRRLEARLRRFREAALRSLAVGPHVRRARRRFRRWRLRLAGAIARGARPRRGVAVLGGRGHARNMACDSPRLKRRLRLRHQRRPAAAPALRGARPFRRTWPCRPRRAPLRASRRCRPET